MSVLRKRSFWTVFWCVSGVLAISATSGLAQSPPVREFAPSEDFVIPRLGEAGGICAFPVEVHWERAKIYNRFLFDSNGDLRKVMFEGNAVAELTNADTKESVVRNISGPGSWDPVTNIQSIDGPWCVILAPDDPDFKGTVVGLYIHKGLLVMDFSGPIAQIIQDSGKWEDLCVTLAPH